MAEIREIEKEIRSLPLGEQMMLYRRLVRHLFGDDTENLPDVHAAVAEEMEQRLADHLSGQTAATPAAVAMMDIRQRMRDGNPAA